MELARQATGKTLASFCKPLLGGYPFNSWNCQRPCFPEL
jgi:hypothetical protein